MLVQSEPRITSFPGFRVEFVITDSGGRRRYHYTTQFNDGRQGEAQLLLMQLGEPPYEFPMEITAVQNGLKEGDWFAGLTEFSPHGNREEEALLPFMRQGVGSNLLESIVEDAVEADCCILFVATKSPSMVAFLNKHGFVCYHNAPSGYKQYYKKI